MSYIVTISGSPAAQSRSTHLLGVAEAQLREAGQTVRRIQIRDLPATPLLHADAAHPALRAAVELVDNAQAVVIATPVYKVSFSGLLKTFLDLLPQTGLAGKVVLPIATGGSLAHLLALDYALKPVLSALGARHVLSNVFGTDREVPWSESGGYTLNDEISARLGVSVDQLRQALAEQHELQAYRSRYAAQGADGEGLAYALPEVARRAVPAGSAARSLA
jgi:FMN reductase